MLRGHDGFVTSAVWPDGSRIVTASGTTPPASQKRDSPDDVRRDLARRPARGWRRRS